MSWKPKNKVFIQTPLMDKNYSLCIEHQDKKICNEFKRLCMREMPEELRWFLQCDGDIYKMFECWVDFKKNQELQDLLFDFGQSVAEKMNLLFDIC